MTLHSITLICIQTKCEVAQHTHTFTSFAREVLDLPCWWTLRCARLIQSEHATHVSTSKWIRTYHVNLSQWNLGHLDCCGRPHHHGVPSQSFEKRHAQKHLPNVHQKAMRASKRPTSRKARSRVLETQDLSYLVCAFFFCTQII